MPICGFNEKMLCGLNEFNEGLVEHGLIHRGSVNDETIDQGIKRELSDMARLQPELCGIEDVPKRVLTTGIVTYSMGFYLVMRQRGLSDNPQRYKEFIGGVNAYFQKMDDRYYSELEGEPNDMRQLVAFLNSLDL